MVGRSGLEINSKQKSNHDIYCVKYVNHMIDIQTIIIFLIIVIMDPTMRERMEALESQGEQLQREAKYR